MTPIDSGIRISKMRGIVPYLFLMMPNFYVLAQTDFSVLVFTKTEGYRHASIESGVEAISELGQQHGFEVVHSEDASLFELDILSKYSVVVFLSTTGDVFDDAQQESFKKYINEGGGFVGIHAATNTEYDWPWYGRLVGAYFEGHPKVQRAEVRLLDSTHLSTSFLPDVWIRKDEWYNYQEVPHDVNVLATLDEQSYEGGTMGSVHPIAWYHHYDGGRAWYTGGGHTPESFEEPLFLQHILGGIMYASGQ